MFVVDFGKAPVKTLSHEKITSHDVAHVPNTHTHAHTSLSATANITSLHPILLYVHFYLLCCKCIN